MTSKQIFVTNKELCLWWNAISHSDEFQKVLLHVRSEMMSREMTPDAMRGARLFEEVLSTMSDGDDTLPLIPAITLDHDLESDLRNPGVQTPAPAKVTPATKKTKTKK